MTKNLPIPIGYFFPDKSDRNIRFQPLASTYKRLKNTKPSERFYNYNDLTVNTVVNYIRFKTGYKYQRIHNNFLQNKVGIADPFYIKAVDTMRADIDGVEDLEQQFQISLRLGMIF